MTRARSLRTHPRRHRISSGHRVPDPAFSRDAAATAPAPCAVRKLERMLQDTRGALPRLIDAGPGAVHRERYPRIDTDAPARRSAVLVLFGAADDTVDAAWSSLPATALDVVLEVRADTLRAHPGEVSFPGGGADPEDADAIETALREAHEEIGLLPADVEVLTTLAEIPLLASNNHVTPVIGWRPRPVPLVAMDPAETASVHRVPVADLLDPRNRFTSVYRRNPRGDFRAPAFQVGDLLVWGFTAMVLDGMFESAGWTIPWDAAHERDV